MDPGVRGTNARPERAHGLWLTRIFNYQNKLIVDINIVSGRRAGQGHQAEQRGPGRNGSLGGRSVFSCLGVLRAARPRGV